MGVTELWGIAVGLSMDAFAVAVCKGLAAPDYKFRRSLICGVWFGVFQAIMPLMGYLLGVKFKDYIVSFDHWIAFALLGVTSFGMIREALDKDGEKADSSFSVISMAVLALATSIDAFAVGITFAFLSVKIFTAVIIIGVCTFVLSMVGVRIGAVFGMKYKSGAEILGGIILLIMGIKILLEHLI